MPGLILFISLIKMIILFLCFCVDVCHHFFQVTRNNVLLFFYILFYSIIMLLVVF
ncbi:hypothetical protein HanPI659440_Chr03g0111391 [Helianthus annuus]|nr:hypothetical protein HanPI659440_Chr03g0111391 [Helianthus annuus]